MIKTADFHINPAFVPALESMNRYLFLMGGAGSGKSVCAAQKILGRVMSKERHRILCIRKVARTIRNSQFKLFKDLIAEQGLSDVFVIKENEMSIVCVNGNEIISAGTDDVEKLKSITNITGVWIEEATELDRYQFTQIDLRLRGKTDSYKQIICTFNPIYVGHWLNNIKLEDCLLLKTTYKDNEFIDEQYKKVLEDLKDEDENFYQIYALGNWGMIRNAERIYHKFSRELTGFYPFNPGAETITAYDFNVNPMTAVILNVVEGVYFQCKEFRVVGSVTEEVAEMVALWLSNFEIRSSLILTGDATGARGGTRSIRSDYDIIRQVYSRYGIPFVLRIPETNPAVRDRVNYVNRLMGSNKFYIDESCTYSIQDRELVQWKRGAEGFSIDKSNPDLTHLSEACDYGLFNTQVLLQDMNQRKESILLGGQRRNS